MRRLLIALAICWSWTCYAQEADTSVGTVTRVDDTTFLAKNRRAFSAINTAYVPSGILLDYGYKFVDLSHYDGIEIDDSNFVNYPILEQINSTLISSEINSIASGNIPTPQALYGSWRANATVNHLAISGILFNYEQFKKDTTLITASDGIIHHKYSGGTLINPFETKTVFAMALPIASLHSLTFVASFPADMWITNLTGQIDSIMFDAGDSLGFRRIHIGDSVIIAYSDTGIKKWNFKVHLGSGDELNTHGSIFIGPLAKTTNTPITINATEPYGGVYGSATIRIEYAHSDQILRKPLIIVEGIDPGSIIQPQDLFGLNDCQQMFDDYFFALEASDPTNELVHQLDNNQYDRVYVDWTNGTDFLESNAMVLKEVIRWVNSHKVGSAQNIVWGISMGGIISRYAIKDMEDNSESHQVRLFISHDAPHLGAHVPLGYQAMCDHLRSYWLGTGWLAGTYQNLIVPLTGALSVTDALSIAYQPAAAEMLIRHTSTFGTNLHSLWQTKLESKGYPAHCRNVAISNGSECGMPQPFNPADEQLNITGQAGTGWLADIALFVGMPVFEIVSFALPSIIPPNLAWIPGSNEWDANFWVKGDADNAAQQVYHGQVVYTKRLFGLIAISQTLTVGDYKSGPTLPWETLPGGYYALPEFIPTAFNSAGNPFFTFNASVFVRNRFGFVPTASALDIGSGATALAKSQFVARYCGLTPPSAPYNSPFANFITNFDPYTNSGAENNSFHAEINSRNADWAGREIGQLPTNPILCQAPCANFPGINGDASMCVGASKNYSVTLTNPTGATFGWSIYPSGIVSMSTSGTNCTLTGIVAGSVTLTAAITNSCNTTGSSYSMTITVVPNIPTETVSFVSADLGNTLDPFGCYFLAKVSPFVQGINYTWSAICFDCATSPTFPVSPNFISQSNVEYYNGVWGFQKVTGAEYIINMTASNQCGTKNVNFHHTVTEGEASITDNCYFSYKEANPNDSTRSSGVLPVATDSRYKVYPNPSDGLLNVSYGGKNSISTKVSLYDMSGRKVMSFTNEKYGNNNTHTYDIHELFPGVYNLELIDNVGNTVHMKVVKN